VQQRSGQEAGRARVLVVMRHAKAEQDGPSDFERRLARRGIADARAAGEWLAAQDVAPDHALVSAAVRTAETWTAVAEGAGWDLEASYDRGLYAAGPETALDLVREAPSGARCLVVIGHNPTIAYLAQLLDDGEGDDAAAAAMTAGYPTGALAVFSYDGEWAALDPGAATLVGFHVARG
jgi:phosphohistidine phosphatase